MPALPTLDADSARELGQRLQDARLKARRSQDDVAQAAGISRNHLQLIEIGLSDRSKRTPANPRLATLIALCSELGVELGSVTAVARVTPVQP